VNEQFGFIKDSSTPAAIYKLLKEALDALNNNSLVGGIFCDTRKAFDCVNHDLLLSKMEFYGIRSKTNRLITSYLSNRYQRVSLNKNSTEYYLYWELFRHGVPQGSTLGPSFFLLYINDLPKVISDISKPILHADDTSIVIFDKVSEKFKFKINTAFDRINKWFQSNFLSLHFEKTKFLQFLTKNSHEIDIQVSYDNNKIDNTHNIKFLGLIVDTSLSWKNHIDQLVCKLNKSVT
jgi:hypothetical protein